MPLSNLPSSSTSSLAAGNHGITILCSNAYLATAHAHVSGGFGWLGKSFLKQTPGVKLIDWDVGDLLDIAGQDFLTW